MNIDKESAERLKEITEEIIDLLGEFKHTVRNAMTSEEYNRFKYRTLGHLEPGLMEDSEWVTTYSSIDSLESVAQDALDSAEKDEDEDEDTEEETETEQTEQN